VVRELRCGRSFRNPSVPSGKDSSWPRKVPHRPH